MNEELLFDDSDLRAEPKALNPDTLSIVIDGWEGPLDLLLMLARCQ